MRKRHKKKKMLKFSWLTRPYPVLASSFNLFVSCGIKTPDYAVSNRTQSLYFPVITATILSLNDA